MSEPLRLGEADAGELLTLQRAAYVTEARAHGDLNLPPLVETLGQLLAVLRDPACFAWGIRLSGRLVASVRVLVRAGVGEVGRLVVAPDQQRRGLGRSMMRALEELLPPEVVTLRLFTGEHSSGPLALYASLGYRETRRTPEGSYEIVNFEKARPRSAAAGVVR
ncbi:GNAT family N-acetyltransferase [Amycolatopsis acidiphila]|uniref:GNAT family N-acetyltransferase n=1 Tax=Amycolatopsis acidiphila TaxID=715473 RepID=A0A558AJT9_9PSEU|nr:GNAT family N-acetyltransferase [Amycolatopsis acidiphila]TVT24523.1 GNAT family N-acetyltransferase [Amycolatopsis acidiphila]UIJ59266.1 GNAT family N-acetyltransferase [Amycolatopsis acidiphila]GHG79406.1 GCN5 family acetyltransferase [Amycolatopsis acidiphila]